MAATPASAVSQFSEMPSERDGVLRRTCNVASTKGLLKKLLPQLDQGVIKELRAEAFTAALETWDPEGSSISYADSFAHWEATKLLGEVTRQLRLQKRSHAEEAGGDVSLVPCQKSPFRGAFRKEVQGIIGTALNLLNPKAKALVVGHFWDEKPLSSQGHKELAKSLVSLRQYFAGQGIAAQDVIWDCGPRKAEIRMAELLF